MTFPSDMMTVFKIRIANASSALVHLAIILNLTALCVGDPGPILYAEALTDQWLGGNLLLSTLGRWNLAQDGTPTVRYPDDPYDRLWSIPHNSDEEFRQDARVNISSGTLKQFNDLPFKVAKDAWQRPENQSFEITLDHQFVPPPDSVICFVLYFYSELTTLHSNLTIQVISQGSDMANVISQTFDYIGQTFEITTNQATMTYLFYEQVMDNHSTLSIDTFYLNTINFLAVEAYQSNKWNTAITDLWQDELIAVIKNGFNMTDWQGDPCLPTPDDWVTCFFHDPELILIESIALSHNYHFDDFIQGLRILPQYLITSAEVIKSWSITYSNLDENSVIELFTTNNLISSDVLESLNVSHNVINSDLFNKTRWKVGRHAYDEWNAPFQSIIWMDLSHNHLSELFLQTDFRAFFSDYELSQLQVLYVDHNNITGTLNLITWFDKIQATFQKPPGHNERDDYIFQKLYSFVNNDILRIVPSVEELESKMNVTLLIKQFNVNAGGLLLGGNPYCKHTKKLLQKFFCRSSIHDMSYAITSRKSSKFPMIASIVGGIFLLIVGCIFSFIILRLRRQVTILRQFQQELLSRKVQPPFFSYYDLKIATKDFHNDNKLGSGAFGAVYRGLLQDKREVAVKKLYNSDGQVQVLNDFLNEVVLLTGIKHRNLVQLLGCCINNKERILVYEYAEKGNVANALWGQNAELPKTMLSWEERLNICVGVAWGLSFLHKELQPGIIHRDIKAANILLDKSLNPKIADFGLAKLFREEETQAQFTFLAGTKGYLAPEYVLDGILTDKADVYSFGVLVLELISGRTCVDPSQPEDKISLKHWAEMLQQKGKLLELLPFGLEEEWPSEEVVKVINIALLCVGREPRLRPTMTQVAIMLTGNANDTNGMFLRLSDKKGLSDKMALQFGTEIDNQPEWISLIPWAGESSATLHNTDLKDSEEDALIGSGEMRPSFASSFSIVDGPSS